jgi:hypothetical protein
MAGARATSRLFAGLRGALLVLLAWSHPSWAEARISVALELVLAIDVSASVDREEFALQIDGIAQAFRHPDVIAAIERAGLGGIAVAIVEWSEPETTQVAVPFHHLTDARSARAFSFLASRVHRASRSSYTSIGGGIARSLDLIEDSEFAGARRVIDVSGDGRNNRNPYPDEVRDRVVKAGVTVNGLAIETDDDTLSQYYRDKVIVGADAFVATARDYGDYVEVIRLKLIREILPPVSAVPRPLRMARAEHVP